MVQTNGNSDHSGLTLTVLGSGVMGVGILSGIMSSIVELNSGTLKPDHDTPDRLPSRFIACDMRKEAEANVQKALGHYNLPLTTLTNENLRGFEAADVVLLACKPYGYRGILGEKGVKAALSGKLLISILAGVTAEDIENCLYGDDSPEQEQDRCTIVRVMPNTASMVRESMTVIETRTPALPSPKLALVTWIFTRIGKVVHLPPNNLDACTALCGSGPAFVAIMLEAMTDGAVAMGIPRAEAQLMAAQTMRGTTGLVLGGEHPAMLKDKVTTPGGCTIGGLMVLEEGGVRGHVAKAIREATVVASKLGQGAAGAHVNGTWR